MPTATKVFRRQRFGMLLFASLGFLVLSTTNVAQPQRVPVDPVLEEFDRLEVYVSSLRDPALNRGTRTVLIRTLRAAERAYVKERPCAATRTATLSPSGSDPETEAGIHRR